MARAQINHAAPGRATGGLIATGNARVEIWLRMTGRRRQAFYRCAAVGITTWQPLGVPLANKAIKAGKISLPGIADAPVEQWEDEEEVHPMASEFAARATALNGEIEAINLAARGAA
ncbi:hypothetical protein [Variovorax sp. CY25R-8]|uniref:hypothetical protein n=1 Tax=Variovorax sp. CY25R-8 TaxID=2855501 RepID=UPI0021BB1C39|nr:hypothetical protein [Variovorax sp. CY25R-8]MCT8174362.1 hypothetical protein [Variovorax sp. CY25R-8]